MPDTPDPSYWGNPPETPHRGGQGAAPGTPMPPASNGAQVPPQAGTPQPQDAAAGFPPQQAAPSAAADPRPTQQPQPTPQAAPQPAPGPAAVPQQQAAPDAAATPQPQAIPQPQAAQQPGYYAAPAGQGQPPYGQPPYNAYPYNTPPAPPAPPAAHKTSHKSAIAAIIVVLVLAALFGIGGCTACTAAVLTLDAGSNYEDLPFNDDTTPPPDYGNDTAYINQSLRSTFGLSGSGSIAESDLATIKSTAFPNATTAPDAQGRYAAGIYRVGTDIPAGTYWFSGSSTDLSYFYVLVNTLNGGTYDTIYANSYYGHNLMELLDGDLLILDNSGTMEPIEAMTDAFTPPYHSGVYRVGTDIPAGTYYLGVGDGADDISACFVMSDLYFDDSSYLYSSTFLPGDDLGTVTLEDGTFVELYNMTMRPALT